MKSCKAGSKKFAKRVRSCSGKMKCVKYGDKSMTIKKHLPGRKKSFCARHKCHTKTDPATPGYQSCKKWSCKTGKKCGSHAKRKTSSTRIKSAKKKTTTMKKNTRKKSTGKKTARKSTKKNKQKKASKKPRRRSPTSKSTSTGKKYVSASGRKYTKCWTGYKRAGWKMKNGRRVPNCVKS